MKSGKKHQIIISILLGVILLIACLPVCAFAEDAELSDGDEAGISLTTTVPPEITAGAGAEYHKGSTDGLTFQTDDAKDNLLRVLVDGQVLSSDKYTVSEEPLTITLHADYLDTLSEGEHTIEIVTTNGNASAKFVVKNAPVTPPPDSPRTGDDSNMGLWISLMALSGVSLAVLLFTDRKRKAKK